MLSELRDADTPPARFQDLVRRIGALLGYEATRDLPVQPVTVATPLEPAQGLRARSPVTIVPILRAGLGLAEGVRQVLTDAQVGHIGMFRDETSLSPVHYYQKLPRNIADGPAFIIDPMLATGGSAVAAVKMLRGRGCSDVRLVCLVAAPEGVDRLIAADPLIPIFTAAVDRGLNQQGYILPGLGDAGDRMFGTTA